MKNKTNNLNSVLESIVSQYFGDFPLDATEEKSKKEQKPILEKQEAPKKQIDLEQTDKKEEIDPNVFLESLREDFFTMLNTTKRIEEKKEISNELEDIAKTFFN
jgi:hypothetical protein